MTSTLASLSPTSDFVQRHIGTGAQEQTHMLQALQLQHIDDLIEQVVPPDIQRQDRLNLPEAVSEEQALAELKRIAEKNTIFKSYIGQGYYGTHTPAVILRNVLENPAWYTAYTPYQAEISQGRLEALLNFQTMVSELSAMDIANASLLDEATAAAEAMTLARQHASAKENVFYVDSDVFPQTLEVLQTRAKTQDIVLRSCSGEEALTNPSFGVLLQYPGNSGAVRDLRAWVQAYRQNNPNGIVVVACDLLALTLLSPPGEWGADIVVGSTQRFGMPMGAGGPHAAFMAIKDALKRSLPGRLVGLSKDVHGQVALRLALQTREQHIRREKATSNVCTAQVLPAVVASMYAVYHGPEGLKNIAQRIASYSALLAQGLQQLSYQCVHSHFFDTISLTLTAKEADALQQQAWDVGINLRRSEAGLVIAIDETTTPTDIEALWGVFAKAGQALPTLPAAAAPLDHALPRDLLRSSAFLQHAVFSEYQSETAMLRYLRKLSDKDLALDRSMIPLGSCTMKLNATSEMLPITWPEFAGMHPFAPDWQQEGYAELNRQLCQWLSNITGYDAVSLEPNAGSQGELAGLLAIRAYHAAQGQEQRTVCLIPASAHGTNPASAKMAGLQVVVVACDALGNVDMQDLQAKCEAHSAKLSCMMITYPSTHGVFETEVRKLCALIHAHGGRVYLDGANMNAMVGLAAPGQLGGDVSHLNLHKTFCIPHGGGGPGVGPVCVVDDLKPFLPRKGTIGAISAAPLGNAAVLPISWMYIRMMGHDGLRQASSCAILAANYISHALAQDYPTLYTSANGWVAHECILDLRGLKESTGVTAEDVAKRLIDYGFHAPTLSFPVAGTLMVEPTESEPLLEIERFIQAMRGIRQEIAKIEQGVWSKTDNPLKNAPHTAQSIAQTDWPHAYSREEAVFPQGVASMSNKYWAPVGRIDNVYGDRNLVCSCPPIAAYAEEAD